MSSYLEDLASQQKKKQQSSDQKFCELVKRIAAGDEPELGEVQAVCSDADKTLDDLKDAVEVIHEYRKHVRKIHEAEEFAQVYQTAMREKKRLVNEDLKAAEEAVQAVKARIAEKDQAADKHNRLQREAQAAKDKRSSLQAKHRFLANID